MSPEEYQITDYGRFRNYLLQLRSAEYPLGRFLTLLLNLPRQVVRSHLMKASFDESFEIRCEVLHLATRLTPVEAGVRSIELLSDPESSVRIVALNAISYLELPCEASVLRLLGSEKNGDVRYAAVLALEVIGTERCLSALESIVASDLTTDFEGRSVAERAALVVPFVQKQQVLGSQ